MQTISAPYNFVPLNQWVHIPEWNQQVSHDWPFKDGLSGEIHYSLIADSPLLVGGHQKPATDQAPGEVHPFKLPDGRYAIPGSSLKGMLRSVVEIAGFGRMRMVDDQRPGLRDITGRNVSASYTDKVRNKVLTGFLRRRADGGQEIVPCSMVRLDHRKLEEAIGARKPVFRARINVGEKYQIWERACRNQRWDPQNIYFDRGDHEAVNLGQGDKTGFPVFTGQISDSTKRNGKYKDFVFYDANEQNPIDVSQNAWRDFLRIHGDEGGQSDMSWPGYWKGKFREGQQVPVFYLQDKDLLRIGLAYMPKLAGDFSIHEIVGHANLAHLQAPGAEHGYDLADLLFGAIGETQKDALRGRVSCETAVAQGQPVPVAQENSILNGPKPTYFPNYITQRTDSRVGSKLRGSQYSTYMQTSAEGRPMARGFKRYPTRSEKLTGVQQLNSDQIANKKVQVRLHPLPTGTKFKGRILFHNLKPEELGALLWAVTWQGDDQLRHSLGMGKSFGFGQVHYILNEEKSRVMPNDPTATESKLDSMQIAARFDTFVRYMEASAKSAELDNGWTKSPQISNLLAMADPRSADHLPDGMQLRHMCLQAKQGINEYTWAKQKSLVLADYAQASRWNQRWQEQQQQQKIKRAAIEEQKQRRAKEEDARRMQAEFDALSEQEKAVVELGKALTRFPAEGPLNKGRYSEFLGVIKPFQEKAEQWNEHQARSTMADCMEKQFNRLGWAPSGLKKDKRQKQEKKRRDMLDKLRSTS